MTPEQKIAAAKIYIASKTKHASKWLRLRGEGVNIISTWIDEAGFGESKDMNDLCLRCINESKECDAMIVYAEQGDYLKGAFIEMGVALSCYLKPIYLVGYVLPAGSAFTYSHQVFSAKSIDHAVELINQHHKPIAGRSAGLEREKELEEGLRMLLKPENREHMISIASATLSGELAKQLLNKVYEDSKRKIKSV